MQKNNRRIMKNKTKLHSIYIGIFLAHVVMFGLIIQNWLDNPEVITIYASEKPEVVPSTTPTPTVALESTTQSVEDIIREVFGEDAEVAIAVAKAESGLNPNTTNFAERDCSVGLFQINLAHDFCNGIRVHWNKVPGDTLDEKVAWLQIPENNIRLAKKIHDASNGFTPWSVYLNDVHLKFLED